MTLIVLGDTAGKALTQHGVPPLYVAWARFTLGALIALPFCGLRRAELPLLTHRKIILRGLLIGSGVACIVTALSTEPLADVFGAFFVGPIVSYILAALFLREPITRWRSALLAMGFAGVLLVVKPGFGAGPGMVFALLAGVFYGAFLAMTRAVAGQYRPRFLILTQLGYAAALLMPVPVLLSAPALTPWLTLLFVVSALCSAGGNLFLVWANRQAPASVIAPLIYTQLIAATILGWLAFGDWPDAVAFAGLAVIFLSGILSLRAAGREGRR
ncbi:DMT family transporter [Thalassococcus sp. CAU 1522]|uniref:DMT family transporter n=2 Tax=Thalassococcus arenae TaxID=2851652 RepID=A0ABS6N8U8_9RHOB|nr:DMT family transporter [Thalassococcus arenae]